MTVVSRSIGGFPNQAAVAESVVGGTSIALDFAVESCQIEAGARPRISPAREA
jgi:hypothetical protein